MITDAASGARPRRSFVVARAPRGLLLVLAIELLRTARAQDEDRFCVPLAFDASIRAPPRPRGLHARLAACAPERSDRGRKSHAPMFARSLAGRTPRKSRSRLALRPGILPRLRQNDRGERSATRTLAANIITEPCGQQARRTTRQSGLRIVTVWYRACERARRWGSVSACLSTPRISLTSHSSTR